MTEEEKKAIEYLKRHIIPCYENKGRIEFMLNDTLLNLIEKLQKEKNELYKFGYMNGCNDTSKFNDKNFIRKDKIRELLKESACEEKYDFHCAYEKLFEDIEKLLEEE